MRGSRFRRRAINTSSRRKPGPIPRDVSIRHRWQRPSAKLLPGVMGPGSSPGRRGENSCFIFPRAGVMRVCVLAARRARAVAIVGPLETQRAQGKPGARCTRGLACNVHREHAHEHTGSAENIRPSLRNGFTAYFALSPATGLSCHRRHADASARLDASVGASGPHDFAVRIGHARQSQLSRPPHPTARFVTIASRPSCRVRRAESNH
jgi:hypothetical protein